MPYIERKHDGHRFLVPVHVLAPSPSLDLEGVSGQALVDTGSTVSGVTSAVADRLGLPRLGKRPLASAHGEGQSERCPFRLALPDEESTTPTFPFVFDDVIGMELGNHFNFDALLGMDILRQCDLRIERSGRCRLWFGPQRA